MERFGLSNCGENIVERRPLWKQLERLLAQGAIE